MSKKKVSILTLGCSKNTVDSERINGMLKSNGINVIEDIDKSDFIIINTCGFIKPAKEESIKVILDACELKKKNKRKKIIVCGCLSERYKEELEGQINKVDYFFGVNAFDEIISAIKPNLKHSLLGERELLTPKHYAYLKIAEGCNHKCSFCAIPLIRGKYHSRNETEIITEVKGLINKGVKEINVIAQDTTYFGVDRTGKSRIAELLKQISDIEGVEWLRLLYTYPLNFPYELLDVIAERDNICKYIDIPLQHISSHILKSMKRPLQTRDLIKKIRDKVPDVSIRSTFITGYPGESETDFEELSDFINSEKLDRVGIFTYSMEEDTSAFGLGDPVSEEVKIQRRNLLMEQQMRISLEKNNSLIGKEIKVIIDSMLGDEYHGRTEFDAPDVDNAVIIKSQSKLGIGDFANIWIQKAEAYDLFGKIK